MISSIRARRRHPMLLGSTGSCPLCGSAGVELLRRDCPDRLLGGNGRWSIVRCRSCGLARTEPRPAPEDLAQFYESEYFTGLLHVPVDDESTPGRQSVSRPRSVMSGILDAAYHARYGPTAVPAPPRVGATVLDVGPGPGYELAEYASRGWEVWAVEPSPQAARAVAASAEVSPERMIVTPAEHARLPQGHFDRVVMSHVVEHLSDPRAALRNVCASMRPGAVLTIRCPNFASIEHRLFGRWWSGLDVPRHLQHFTPRTLNFLLELCGLRTLGVRPQLEYASPSFSLGLAMHCGLPRKPPYRPSWRLYLACLPFVAFGRALGVAGNIEAAVTRR